MDSENLYEDYWFDLCKKRKSFLSKEITDRLNYFVENEKNIRRLNVIKRTRKQPSAGDYFEIRPLEDIVLFGLVLNPEVVFAGEKNYINIIIFKKDILDKLNSLHRFEEKDIFMGPCIVTKAYWNNGYFHTLDNVRIEIEDDLLGFYDMVKCKFVDENRNELNGKPMKFNLYSAYTIDGIGNEIFSELIIRDLWNPVEG
jgi:hypothetical protein